MALFLVSLAHQQLARLHILLAFEMLSWYINNITDNQECSGMSKNMEGALWALVATVLYAISAALGKFAAAEFHILQILFFRQLVVFASVLPTVTRNFPENLKTNYPLAHGFRLAGAFIAMSMGLWAITVLPLATAVVLMFSQTFFVTLLALWFLGEGIGLHRALSIVVGFVGVIIVVRPGPEGFADLNSLIPLGAAVGASIAVIVVRKLSQIERTATLLSYQAIFVGLLSGAPLFWLWVTPDLSDLVLLLGIGVIATVGQWIGIKALRAGEASLVSSIKYTELIHAAILGYWFFGDSPDVWTLTGAAIIIGSALYMIRREAKLAKLVPVAA
jgi:drug/metabolite transporter (DMT)-like permease